MPAAIIKKKKKSRSESSYGSYIHKVMKRVHPDLSGSRSAIETVNSMLDFLVSKLAQNAVNVAGVAKKSTLSARHIQASCRVHLPGDVANHAISEGTKAVAKFQS